MSQKKLETAVKANASKLEKLSSKLKGHAGQFVAFNGKDLHFTSTYSEAVEYGDGSFGELSGYVVRKVGFVPTLSHLVKG